MPTQTILSTPSSQRPLLGSCHLAEALNVDHGACSLPPTPTAPSCRRGTPHAQDGSPHSGIRNLPCWLESSYWSVAPAQTSCSPAPAPAPLAPSAG